MTSEKKPLTQPHALVMEAGQMPVRSDLLEAEDSTLEQKNTTRISPTSSLRTVSLCSWKILEPERREASEIRAYPQSRMRTSRLVQQGKVPPEHKPSLKQ